LFDVERNERLFVVVGRRRYEASKQAAAGIAAVLVERGVKRMID
jgi:hypothetical protein